jgi:cytoskeletal protein RodZ
MVATPAGVDEVSRTLRSARERSGLEIEEISARTKINPVFLRALETGHFEVLPGHFFTRAFIRSYAHELGLSPDEVAAAYDRAHGAAPPTGVAVIAPPSEREHEGSPRALPASRQLPATWQMAAAAGLVLVIMFFANRPERSAPVSPPAVATSGGEEAPAPVATTATIAAPESLTIQIQPAETVWVAASADGSPVIYKLLQPGQRVTVTGRTFVFRVGNAAGFVYSVNGAPGKPLGGANEVREFSISTQNYREYLR